MKKTIIKIDVFFNKKIKNLYLLKHVEQHITEPFPRHSGVAQKPLPQKVGSEHLAVHLEHLEPRGVHVLRLAGDRQFAAVAHGLLELLELGLGGEGQLHEREAVRVRRDLGVHGRQVAVQSAVQVKAAYCEVPVHVRVFVGLFSVFNIFDVLNIILMFFDILNEFFKSLFKTVLFIIAEN